MKLTLLVYLAKTQNVSEKKNSFPLGGQHMTAKRNNQQSL